MGAGHEEEEDIQASGIQTSGTNSWGVEGAGPSSWEMDATSSNRWSIEAEASEALMQPSHSILGLKVADEQEAATVSRVGGAVLGLMVLLALHFVVHVAHHGHVLHALYHLLVAAMLPGAGYVAVAQRSTKATWAFHLMAVMSSLLHALILLVVLAHFLGAGSLHEPRDCAKMESRCNPDFWKSDLRPLTFSANRDFWKCRSGACIAGGRRCDGEVNCFDGSDETGCIDAEAAVDPHMPQSDSPVTAPPSTPGLEALRCLEFRKTQEQMKEHAPRLRIWWLVMSLPMWALCLFAAYHSLEFYMQLRLRGLTARVDRASAGATVFTRSELEQEGDAVAE